MNSLKFYYGRDVAWWQYLLILVNMVTLARMLTNDLKNPTEHQTAIYFDIVFLILGVSLVSYWIYIQIDAYLKKRANKVAIELTETEIIKGDQHIPWFEVYNLTFVNDKVSVIFNDDTKAPVTVGMRKIKGDAFENYNLMYDHMEAIEKHTSGNTLNASL